MRFWVVLATALAGVGAHVSVASAGTVRGLGTAAVTLRFEGAPGEANTVTISASALDQTEGLHYARVTVTDTTAPLVAGDHCQPVDAHTARCESTLGFNNIDMSLGDGDDEATLGPLQFSYVWGGEGDDVLNGMDTGSDHLSGEAGNDTLNGRGGNDRLDHAFLTEDPAAIQAGSDAYIGGAGSDSLGYDHRTAAVSVTLDGVANDGEVGEHDNVAADVDAIDGGTGDDVLVAGDGNHYFNGLAGDDRLQGASGNDALEGGFGHDRVDGAAGNDLIFTEYGGDDDVHGGAGVDTIVRNDSAPATISLDDQPNDGVAGAGENIHSDVENVTGSYRATIYGSAAANDLRTRKPDLEFPPYGPLAGSEMHGGAGNDTLTTYSGDDYLYGDAGADTIDGGYGRDYISGGPGFDVINARDGDSTDTVSCGVGVDRVTADKGDNVAKDCEIVNRIL